MALRKIASASPHQLLDPWTLAPLVGLHVVDGRKAMENLTEEDCRHLQCGANSEWSGGVYPVPLPDGTLICILNPNHSHRRSKITLMEEIVHTHLKHIPSKVMQGSTDGLRFRDYDSKQEREAFGIGAATLLPWATFYSAIDSGQTVKSMAEQYQVTTQLIEYRIKITGAYRLFQSRGK